MKFTTSRLVAEKTIKRMFRREVSATPYEDFARPTASDWPALSDVRRQWREDPAEMRAMLQRLAEEESVQFVEDLLLRRTDWAASFAEARRLTSELREWMPWLPCEPRTAEGNSAMANLRNGRVNSARTTTDGGVRK